MTIARLAGDLNLGLAVDGFDVLELGWWVNCLRALDKARAEQEGRLVSELLGGKR